MTKSLHPRKWAAIAGFVVVVMVSACGTAGGGNASASSGATAGGTAAADNPADVTLASLSKQVDLTQCGKDSRTIKHDLGTTTIKGTPTRIVALELSFADALAAAGVQPVGIADDKKTSKVTGLQDGITNYTSVGLRSAPNLTVISSLKPDLIIADTSRDKAVYGQLDAIAPTISLTSLGAGYTDVLKTDLVVAEAANRCQAMTDTLTKHFAAMKSIAAQLPAGAHDTSLYADIEPPNFYAHSANQWEPQIMATVGLKSVLPDSAGSRNTSLTLEQLFSYNPQVMFLGSNGEQSVVDQWQTSPVWQQITAVQHKKVFTVSDGLWSQERGIKTSESVLRQVVQDLRNAGQ